MTEMSPLRRRMIEAMTVRNLSPATQRSYVHAVAKFGRFFGRSPDRLDLEDVRTFQVDLVAGGMFASAHIAPQLLCLLEGQPDWAGVTLGDSGAPQHNDIDALIGHAVVPQGTGDLACHVLGVPRPVPRAHAFFEVGNDLDSDAAVNIGARF